MLIIQPEIHKLYRLNHIARIATRATGGQEPGDGRGSMDWR